MTSMLAALILLSVDATCALGVPGRAAARGRGGVGRGRGRGTFGGARTADGRHVPKYAAPTGRRQNTAEDARRLDLFGPPGEWRARKGAREWLAYGESNGAPAYGGMDNGADGWAGDGSSRHDDGGAAGAPVAKIDDLAVPPDFAPKMWRAEAGGGKAASFFAPAASFAELGASEALQAALAASGAERPSHVQAAGFQPILSGDDVALADQTGSGKTLAYLAPIVQAAREAEAGGGRTPGGHVRALVLTPTSELAQQVLRVAKGLSQHGAPFRSSIITGEHKWRTQAKAAAGGLELLVCTPGRLRAHLEEGSFSLALTSHVVLDEADLLFEDEDFEDTWAALREALPDTASTAFVTATLPNWLVSRIQEELPLAKLLKGNNLHRTAAGVQETIVDCSAGERVRGDGDAGFRLKAAALARELVDGQVADRILIFCNTIESCRRVENLLRRKDRRGDRYQVLAFHGAIPAEARKKTLAAFTAPSGSYQGGYDARGDDDGRGGDNGWYDGDGHSRRAPVPNGQPAVPRVLVCTDRASRGMDFSEVGHVILFDFPRDGVEYVRRVGRVTRGTNTPGRVTSLVLGRQLGYARELMKINREGGAVDLDVHGSSRGLAEDDSNMGNEEEYEPWKANWKEPRR